MLTPERVALRSCLGLTYICLHVYVHALMGINFVTGVYFVYSGVFILPPAADPLSTSYFTDLVMVSGFLLLAASIFTAVISACVWHNERNPFESSSTTFLHVMDAVKVSCIASFFSCPAGAIMTWAYATLSDEDMDMWGEVDIRLVKQVSWMPIIFVLTFLPFVLLMAAFTWKAVETARKRTSRYLYEV
jgi:hypothetical protein